LYVSLVSSKSFNIDKKNIQQKTDFIKFFKLCLSKTIYDEMKKIFKKLGYYNENVGVNLNDEEERDNAVTLNTEVKNLKKLEEKSDFGKNYGMKASVKATEDKDEVNKNKKESSFKSGYTDLENFMLAIALDPYDFMVILLKYNLNTNLIGSNKIHRQL